MNFARLAETLPQGFWVEPADGNTLKVGVIDNRDAHHVEAELSRIREELRARGLRTRFSGREHFRLLRVW